jgi:hypothetical protein
MKIPQYQRGQLASSAVGVPGQDRSGEIIAEGVQRGVSAVAAMWGEREKEKRNILKNEKLADLQIGVAKAEVENQRQFRDDPAKYVEAMTSVTDRMADDLSKDMDSTTALDFKTSASGVKAGYARSWNTWAFNRDNEIISGKLEGLYIKATSLVETSTTDEQLNAHLNNFSVVDSQARKFWDEQTVIKKGKLYRAQAIKGFATNRLTANPHKFMQELQTGKYDKLLVEADVSRKALEATTMEYINLEKRMRIFQTGMSGIAEIDALTQSIVDGNELDMAQLNRKIEWAEKNKGVVPEVTVDYVDSLRNLRAMAVEMGGDKTQRKAISAEAYKLWQADWSEFLGSSESKKGQASFDNIFRLYGKAANMYREGYMSESDLSKVRKTIETVQKNRVGKGQKVSNLTEALQNAGRKGWFSGSGDIYSRGFQDIENTVNGMTAYSDEQRRQLKLDFMAEFAVQVDKLPQDTLRQVVGEKNGTAIDQVLPRIMGVMKENVGAVGSDGMYYQTGQPVTRNGQAYVVKVQPDGSVGYIPASNVKKLIETR